jgi:hypothetical protein
MDKISTKELNEKLAILWYDISTLASTPDLFSPKKIEEIAEHARHELMCLWRSIASEDEIDNLNFKAIEAASMGQHDYENWTSRRHLEEAEEDKVDG